MFIVRNGRKLELTDREIYTAYREYSIGMYKNLLKQQFANNTYQLNIESPMIVDFVQNEATLNTLAHEIDRFVVKYGQTRDEAFASAINTYLPILFTQWQNEHPEYAQSEQTTPATEPEQTGEDPVTHDSEPSTDHEATTDPEKPESGPEQGE